LAEWIDRVTEWPGRQLYRLAKAVGRWFRWLKFDKLPLPAFTGELFMETLLFAALAGLLLLLVRLGFRGRFWGPQRGSVAQEPGGIARLSELPADVWRGLSDPWSEAARRRAAGDRCGAVVYLFAYQLLTLSRAGVIRLVPGRTGRQYVSTLRDPLVQGSAAATLRLFEDFYYGHREPGAEAFEAVWSQAEAFRAKLLGTAP
jgi:hypothetical protein